MSDATQESVKIEPKAKVLVQQCLKARLKTKFADESGPEEFVEVSF